MARRPRDDEERSMDSLMDALTNVVGILLLILIISSLGISAAVKKVVENLPEVTKEELEAVKASREATLKNLEELRLVQQRTEANVPTAERQVQISAEIEEIERDNADLADKTADIAEWQRKVEEEEAAKTENEAKVQTSDSRNRELAALLAQTPEAAAVAAKDVLLPNPRLAETDSRAFYLVCKGGRLYFIGDPYEHAFKIRDVIEQNFADLAYAGKAIGSYTYEVKDTRKSDSGAYLPKRERFRLNRGDRDDLGAWAALTPAWTNREGVEAKPASVIDRIFGAQEEAELAVAKFRYDIKKIQAYFGDGKLGPKDFKYHVAPSSGDKIKMALEMKPEGGWTPDQFLAANSEFEQQCKQAATARRSLFFYYVAPDSFEIYLQARSKSEQFRVPAGWTVWEGDKLEPRASPALATIRYNLDRLPDAEYMKLANAVGPYLVEERNKEHAEFADRVAKAMPADLKEQAAKDDFVAKLTVERREWGVSRLQPWTLAVFQAALAAQKASGETEIVLEEHPPEIPGIRVFQPSGPPSKPTPPPDPSKPPPRPAPPAGGPATLILD